jgi:hypothetical protein
MGAAQPQGMSNASNNDLDDMQMRLELLMGDGPSMAPSRKMQRNISEEAEQLDMMCDAEEAQDEMMCLSAAAPMQIAPREMVIT